MDLSQRIQAKTDNGDLIIDFLTGVMTDELDDFMLCHRLQAARLLTKYGCNCRGPALAQRNEGIAFILDNPREPSRYSTDSSSSDNTEFDLALAKKIQESTDDGAKVCRFLINVMEGQLKSFKPHHRISAARELLDRGFGKHATPRHSGGGRNPEETGRGEIHNHQPAPSLPAHLPPVGAGFKPAPTRSDTGSDTFTPEDDDWSAFIELVTPILDEDDRIKAELAKQDPDPDNPPYERDLSAYDQAWENSEKWFYEWKNSLDPEEYEAIVARELGEFNAMIDTKIERRKQIKADRERREKEEAEQQAQQAKARAKAKEKADAESAAAEEEEALGPPPTKEEHELVSATPSIPGSYVLRNCRHPRCKLHDGPKRYPEDDRNSPYYSSGRAPLGATTTSDIMGIPHHF